MWTLSRARPASNAAQRTALLLRGFASEGGDNQTLTKRYEDLIHEGTLLPDPAQRGLVERLEVLRGELGAYGEALAGHRKVLRAYRQERAVRLDEMRRRDEETATRLEAEARERAARELDGIGVLARARAALGGAWAAAVGGDAGPGEAGGEGGTLKREHPRVAERRREAEHDAAHPPPPPPPQPRGVYVHGGVGSGKSMVMDLFFDSTAGQGTGVARRRRLHFHAAMLELHARMHAWEQAHHPPGSWAQSGGVEGEEGEGAVGPLEGGMYVGQWRAARRAERERRSAVLAARRRARVAAKEGAALGSGGTGEVLRKVAGGWLGPEGRGAGPGGEAGNEEEDEDLPEASVLCFDEFQVTDAFTAVALKGVLEELMRRGAVVVATSNRPPGELNKAGLQREMFMDFVRALEARVDVHEMAGGQDYRRLLSPPSPPALPASSPAAGPPPASLRYFWPLGPPADAAMGRLFDQVAGAAGGGGCGAGRPGVVEVLFNRRLHVPVSRGGSAWFDFEDLCGAPLGAADYIALAQTHHTVFLSGIPVMSLQDRDRARRFITLVDELYNHRCSLVCSAAAAPEGLFCGELASGGALLTPEELEGLQFETAAEGGRLRRDVTRDGGVAPVAAGEAGAKAAAAHLSGVEEKFAFSRAVSRLLEMQAEPYLRSRPRFT